MDSSVIILVVVNLAVLVLVALIFGGFVQTKKDVISSVGGIGSNIDGNIDGIGDKVAVTVSGLDKEVEKTIDDLGVKIDTSVSGISKQLDKMNAAEDQINSVVSYLNNPVTIGLLKAAINAKNFLGGLGL